MSVVDDEVLPPTELSSSNAPSVDQTVPETLESGDDHEHNSLVSSSYDDESSEAERIRNRRRFRGAPHKGRRLVAAERDLVASLEALEADDLSIQLYNVHSLKQRLRPKPNTAQNVNQWSKKERWATEVDENTSQNAKKRDWMPKTNWTAWPLAPDRVPRPFEKFSRSQEAPADEADVVKKPQRRREKPSLKLEECLLAEILKQAREQFYSSDLHVTEYPVYHSKEAANGAAAVAAEALAATERPKKRLKTGDTQTTPSLVPIDPKSEPSSSANALHEDPQQVVIMADEEEAQMIVQPAIRHVLSKFDGLLAALHRSRMNHLNRDMSDSEIGGSSNFPSSDEATPGSLSSSSRPNSAQRKRRRTEESLKRALRALHPRDWSEVLGTAALIGWDEKVVKRASARCSKLFGESMSFRILQERQAEEEQSSRPPSRDHSSYSVPKTDEEKPSDHGLSSRDNPTSRVRYKPYVGPLLCPVRSCRQHKKQKIWETSGMLTRHMKMVHGYDDTQGIINDDHDSAGDDSTKEDMHGGVHVDGFLQPLKVRAEWLHHGKATSAAEHAARTEYQYEDVAEAVEGDESETDSDDT